MALLDDRQIKNLTARKEIELFPGQIENEEILIFVRRHWISFMGWLGISLVMFLFPVVILGTIIATNTSGLVQGDGLIITSLITSGYYLLTSAVLLTAWIEHYLDVSIITTDRLVNIRQVGLFNRRVAELSLLRVQDVSAQITGYLQSVFQYGTVVVETAGEAPNFIMRNVAKPHVVANTILMIHERMASTAVGNSQVRRDLGVGYQYQGVGAEMNRQLQKVPNSTPPHDFEHQRQHLNENLLTQAAEAKEHLEKQHSSSLPVNLVAEKSPNRLRAMPSIDSEEELLEGETISFD